ncbi:prolyl oligopeptidase family serine peptidase [Aquimarina sp. I32.4]|uniref:prolyl oligopeptidase family serine peptidase n=1 Tax=Aquimarina sp. I32.4 TaxID=2053903 RepID=UPI001304E83E|nr:prolyl oligopeptidase family serine peptidase [Aquimarina sp. I32.4]
MGQIHKIFFIVLCICLVNCKKAHKHTAIDTYFGQQIHDDYHYLENINDSTVVGWIMDQNTRTQNVLYGISGRKNLIVKQNNNNKRNYVISKLQITDDHQIFYLKRNSIDNVSRLYYRKKINDTEVELFNPIYFDSESKSEYQINYFKPNWDGSKIVISIMKDGDEYSQMIILDVKTKNILPDRISNCKPTIGGVEWLPDNNSFYYSHFPNANKKNKQTNLNSKAVIYTLGTNSNDKKEVFSKERNPEIAIKPEDFPIIDFSDPKSQYVIGKIGESSPYSNSYYTTIDQLYKNKHTWTPLFEKTHKIKNYKIVGDNVFFITASGSPNFKICKTNMHTKNFDTPEVLVAEKNNEIIKYFIATKEGIFFTTVINGVQAKLYRYFDGKQTEISLPKPAADIKLYTHGTKVIIAAKGWLNKTKRYVYRHETESLAPYNLFPDQQIDTFDDLMVEELIVRSKDGVEIPLSLVYKKGTKLEGNTPVLMRAYGAYGVSMVPNSYYPFLLYAREGGIYAVAHVRGGGEKGDSWYKGGHKATKPNSWKDFIACTEYLIANKYTSKGKIAIWSGSAGGIVIGRAITERPDLYNAAIIDRGMLNTIRLENGINGANSAKEFGSVKDSIGFKALLEMDSYHHIKDNTNYPATLITTGMNDTRVPSWQSMKFAARLQKANISDNPILLKTEFNSGHGLQFTKNKEFETMATALSFALWQTGHPEYQPKE